MPENRNYSAMLHRGDSLLRVNCGKVNSRRLLLGAAVLMAGNAWSAETSYIGGAGLNYKFDDNITLSVDNQIALSGWILDGFVKGSYATSRFKASADLKLDFERYNRASLDTDNPLLLDPEPEDFNSDNQDLKADIAYDWERNSLSLYGRYWRDSTLNTAFLDTGLGRRDADTGLVQREIEGATRRTESTLSPAWKWLITEKQTLDTNLQGQTVDYESDRYVDFDYASANVNWTYILTERMRLQLQPYYSWFENEADIAVKSNTYGLQAGFLWAVTEKWQWDILAGGSNVYSEYGQGSLVEDQDTRGYIGNTTLGFTEERYGFSANLSSNISPSGNGILQQRNQGRLTFYWRPLERMRFDIDGLVGRSTSTDDRIDDGREYTQAGIRLAYQFLQEWWVSARYRYRAQELDRVDVGVVDGGVASGNSAFVTLSYRLPKEIF